jgi:hypothetical protein
VAGHPAARELLPALATDVAKPRWCWPGGCQNTMDVAFCIDALDETLARFGRPEIFNTDQGSQFTSALHLPARRQHRGHDAALGRRCRVAHMPTAATATTIDLGLTEAGNGAGFHLGRPIQWPQEPGPPLARSLPRSRLIVQPASAQCAAFATGCCCWRRAFSVTRSSARFSANRFACASDAVL